ncbi:MAG TPA: right-handed parallel beta-helix repeat-containing protein, partial [bacterium]|nr:right-handed parallel beta-helix repeat-containing protein [bacterium]
GTYNYDHQVTVDKRVAIVGESSNNTTINISGQHGFLVDQIMLPQAVKFENLHIRGSGNVSTIQTRNSRVLIKDTKITNSLGHGLFISGGQVEVKNNLFYGIALHSIFVAKAPLVPPSPMTQVIIFNNIITASHQTGLFIQNNDPNTIITVARNLFADNRIGALHTLANTPQNGRNTASLFSFNNTFVGNQGPVIGADDGSSFNKNNIYAFNDGPDMEPNGLQLGMQQREYNLTFGNTPDNLRFDPNTLNADPKFPATDNGVSSGLTENTLTDALKDWPVDSLRGKFLIANEFKNVYYISGNTSNTITILVNHPDHELTDMTAVGQPYMIIDGFVLAPDSPAINTGTPA